MEELENKERNTVEEEPALSDAVLPDNRDFFLLNQETRNSTTSVQSGFPQLEIVSTGNNAAANELPRQTKPEQPAADQLPATESANPAQRLLQVLPDYIANLNLVPGRPGDKQLAALLTGNGDADKLLQDLTELAKTDAHGRKRLQEFQFIHSVLQVDEQLKKVQQQRQMGKPDDNSQALLETRMVKLATSVWAGELPVGKPAETMGLPAWPPSTPLGKQAEKYFDQLRRMGFGQEVDTAVTDAQHNWNKDTGIIKSAFAGAVKGDRAAIETLENSPLALQDSRLRQILPELKVVCAVSGINENSDPAVIAKALERLMATKKDAGGNNFADKVLETLKPVLGDADSAQLDKLSDDDLKKIGSLLSTDKNLQERISEFKTMALFQDLNPDTAPAAIERLSQSLKLLPDSQLKQKWEQWAGAQTSLRDLQNPDNAKDAVEKLAARALRGDASATEVLRSIILHGNDKAEKSWRTSQGPSTDSLPLDKVDLSKYSSRQIDELKVNAFEKYADVILARGLTQVDATALAHMSISNGENRALRDGQQKLTEKLVGTGSPEEGRAARLSTLMQGHFRTLMTADQTSEQRTLALSSYQSLDRLMQLPEIRHYPANQTLGIMVDSAKDLAGQGNASAARFLAFVAADSGNVKQTNTAPERASKALVELSKDQQHRPMVIRALTDSALNGSAKDNGYRLSTLSEVVLAGQRPTLEGKLTNPDFDERVQRTLTQTFNGENKDAVVAMLKMAPYLNSENVGQLAKNPNAIMPEAISAFAKNMAPSMRAELVHGLLKNLPASTDASSWETVSKSIKAMGPYLDERSIAAISSLGGKSGREFIQTQVSGQPEQVRKEVADQAQKHLAEALLSTAAESSDPAVRALALRAFAGRDWGGQFNPTKNVDQALRIAEFIKNNPNDPFIQSELPKLIHIHPHSQRPELAAENRNSPVQQESRLASAWMKQGVNEAAALLVGEAVEKYGLDKVKTATENFAYARSLPEQARKELGLSELDSHSSADVLQMLANGTADKTWAKVLLEPIGPGVANYQEKLTEQIARLSEELRESTPKPASKEAGVIGTLRSVDRYLRRVDQAVNQGDLSKLSPDSKPEAPAKTAAELDRIRQMEKMREHSERGVGWFNKVFSDAGISDAQKHFESREATLLQQYERIQKARTARLEELTSLIAAKQQLEIAQSNHQWTRLMHEGKVADADLLAKRTFATYGTAVRNTAPDMWKELSAGGEGVNKGVFGRMKEVNAGLLSRMPASTNFGTDAGFQQSIKNLVDLSSSDVNSDWLKGIDADLIRKNAMTGIQAHPLMQDYSKRMIAINQNVQQLREFMSIAAKGDKFDGVIDEMRKLEEQIRPLLRTSAEDLKGLAKLEADLVQSLYSTDKAKYVQDPEARRLLQEQLTNVRNLRGAFDPAYSSVDPERRNTLTARLKFLTDDLVPMDKKLPANWSSMVSEEVKKDLNYNEKLMQRYLIDRVVAKEISQIRAELAPTQIHQVFKMFENLKDPKFNNPSTLRDWWQQEGLPAAVSVGAMTLALVACSNPVTGVAVGSVLAVVGNDLAKEIQVQEGLRGDGSRFGDYYIRSKKATNEWGDERPMELGRDVLLPMAEDVAFNLATGYAGSYLGGIAGNQILRGAGVMRGRLTPALNQDLVMAAENARAMLVATAKYPGVRQAVLAGEQGANFGLSLAAEKGLSDLDRALFTQGLHERSALHAHLANPGVAAFFHATKAALKGSRPLPAQFKGREHGNHEIQRVTKVELQETTPKAIEDYKAEAVKRGSTIIEAKDGNGFVEVTKQGLPIWYEPKSIPRSAKAEFEGDLGSSLHDLQLPPDSPLVTQAVPADLRPGTTRLEINGTQVDVPLGESVNKTIGRDPENDIVIANKKVSSFHASVRVSESGEVFITDRKSTNGIFVNNERILPGNEVALKPTDVVTVGQEVAPLRLYRAEPVHAAKVKQPESKFKRSDALPELELVAEQPGVTALRERNPFMNTSTAPNGDKATYQFRYQGKDMELKVGGPEVEVYPGGPKVGLDAEGLYVQEPKNVNWPTSVNGETAAPGEKVRILPTDAIVFLKPDTPVNNYLHILPAEVGQVPKNLRPNEAAVAASNDYATGHEVVGRLPNGFRVAGAHAKFDAQGNVIARGGNPRDTVVVDTVNDPVLRATIELARQKFGHLEPEARAEALRAFCQELLNPHGMHPLHLNETYSQWHSKFAGKEVFLGEYIKQGQGVCSQQALLMHVLSTELGLQSILVRGGAGGPNRLNGYNHVWTIGEGNRIYDPRAREIIARSAEAQIYRRGSVSNVIASGRADLVLKGQQVNVGAKTEVVGKADFEAGKEPNSKLVSDKHVEFSRHSSGLLTIKDVSEHGTWVNGMQLTKGMEYQLKATDKVRLGSPDGPTVELMMIPQEVVSAGKNIRLAANEEITIGLQHTDKVPLNSDNPLLTAVSGEHAKLRRDSSGVIMIKDVSELGTWVNGVQLPKGFEMPLPTDAVITLGHKNGPEVKLSYPTGNADSKNGGQAGPQAGTNGTRPAAGQGKRTSTSLSELELPSEPTTTGGAKHTTDSARPPAVESNGKSQSGLERQSTSVEQPPSVGDVFSDMLNDAAFRKDMKAVGDRLEAIKQQIQKANVSTDEQAAGLLATLKTQHPELAPTIESTKGATSQEVLKKVRTRLNDVSTVCKDLQKEKVNLSPARLLEKPNYNLLTAMLADSPASKQLLEKLNQVRQLENAQPVADHLLNVSSTLSTDDIGRVIYEWQKNNKNLPAGTVQLPELVKQLKSALKDRPDAGRLKEQLDIMDADIQHRLSYRGNFAPTQPPPAFVDGTGKDVRVTKGDVFAAKVSEFQKHVNALTDGMDASQKKTISEFVSEVPGDAYFMRAVNKGSNVLLVAANPSYAFDNGMKYYIQTAGPDGASSERLHVTWSNGSVYEVKVETKGGGRQVLYNSSKPDTYDPQLPYRQFGFDNPKSFIGYLTSLPGSGKYER